MSNSWKQYGGISKTDKFHKFSVGTLIADDILLRQKYSGVFEFLGSINVAGDIVGKSRLSILDATKQQTIDISTNVAIHIPTYMSNKVYFGTNRTDYFSGGAYGIGINTPDPSGTFHIKTRTHGNTITTLGGISYNDGLVVSSDTVKSSALLTKNNLSKGIRAVADSDSTSLEFFDNTNADSLASIRYDSTIGSLAFATDLLQFGDANQIKYRPDIYKRNGQYDIRSGISLRLKSGYAANNISNTFVTLNSGDGRGIALGGGVMPENGSDKEFGVICTRNTNDENIEGIMIKATGDKYKHRINIGLNTYNPNDNYTLNVNGKMLLQQGEINKVENIPIQVDGVMKPNIGDTLVLTDSSYNPPARIMRDDANPGTMYLFSSPDAAKSILEKKNTGTTTKYIYDIYKTTDSGENWTTLSLPDAIRQPDTDILSNLSLTTPIHYTHNNAQTFLFSAGRNRVYKYSINGGINWYTLTMAAPGVSPGTPYLFESGQDTIYVDAWTNGTRTNANDNILPNIVLFFITLNEDATKTTAHFFNVADVPQSDYNITQGGGSAYNLNDALLVLPNTISTGVGADINVTNGNSNNYTGRVEIPDAFCSSKSIGNYVYFLGTGIYIYHKIDFNTPTRTTNLPVELNTTATNSNKIGVNDEYIVVNGDGTQTFKYVMQYDSYTIAIGDNFIMYATDANTTVHTNWNIMRIKDIPGLNISHIPTMRHIEVVSDTEMYMVGDGLFLYNNSGIANITDINSWKKVPDNLLNIGGSANAIINENSKLINIHKKDSENFYIIRAVEDYDYKRTILNSQIDENTKLISGSTTMYNAYIPGLFETNPQDIMDICGNVTIDGKITINNRADFSDDISCNGVLEANSAIFNGLSVYNNDVSMNEHLFVLKDASFNNNITVTNNTITNDLSVNNVAYIKHGVITDLSSNGVLESNVAYIKQGFITDLSCNGVLESNGLLKANSAIFSGLSVHNNDVSMNEHLFVLKDASFNNNITVTNNTITNDLSVNNVAYIKQGFITDLSVNSVLESNGLLKANSAIFSGLSVHNNDVSMNEHLFVLKDASFNNNITVTNNTITNDLSVNNVAYIKQGFITDLSVNSGYISDLSSNITHINRLGVNANTITETNEVKYVMEIRGAIKGNGEPFHQF